MLSNLRRRITYANVIATMALFVALGGTSVAAVSLKKNSVGPKQIKAGAVKNGELAKGAVTSAKVKDKSLSRRDFKPGQIFDGGRGAQGPRGAQGLQGPAGPTFASVAGGASTLMPKPTPDIQELGPTHTFTTPTAGRLLVFATNKGVSLSCPGDALGVIFLTLDGVPVLTTRKNANGSTTSYASFGVSPRVAAGSHTVRLAADCPVAGSGRGSGHHPDGDVGAVLLGS